MTPSREEPFDQIGYWSEIKLDIVREYAAAYSRILSAQRNPSLYHIYIDAFAGAGVHISKASGEFVLGSPLNALLVQPPFREYHFVDLDGVKVDHLRQVVGERPDVRIHHGDCNRVLLDEVFPKVRYADYRRSLCLLDPYGLHLEWQVIEKAGQMKTIDLFLNFPVLDINRNVLWRDQEGVASEQVRRMKGFWGDDSWKQIAYRPAAQMELWGSPAIEKAPNEAVAEAFRKRLKEVAGFNNVPTPIAMRNKQNAVVYYLYFASQKPVAGEIMGDIFAKYKDRRGA